MVYIYDVVVVRLVFVGCLFMVLLFGYLVVVWCFVVDSVVYEFGVFGGVCFVLELCGFFFYGWVLDEGVCVLFGDFEVVLVFGYENIRYGVVVEFLVVLLIIVFVGVLLVFVGV